MGEMRDGLMKMSSEKPELCPEGSLMFRVILVVMLWQVRVR